MKKKGKLTGLLLLILSVGLVGCGKEEAHIPAPSVSSSVVSEDTVSQESIPTHQVSVNETETEDEQTQLQTSEGENGDIETEMLDEESANEVAEALEESGEEYGYDFKGTQIGYQGGLCYVLVDGKGIALDLANNGWGDASPETRMIGDTETLIGYTFNGGYVMMSVKAYVGGAEGVRGATTGLTKQSEQLSHGEYTFDVYMGDYVGIAYCSQLDCYISLMSMEALDETYIPYIIDNYILILDAGQ